MTEFNPTINDFAKFLQEKPDIRFERISPCQCPVAFYLTSRTGKQHSVTGDTYMIYNQELTRKPTKKWMRNFIRKFDNTLLRSFEQYNKAHALKILEKTTKRKLS